MLGNQRGLCYPEMLMCGAMVGGLVSVAAPVYSSYINVAQSVEAVSFLGTMRQYVDIYYQTHGSYPKTGDWMADFIGNQNTYFEYSYDFNDQNPKIIARGITQPFTAQDTLVYSFNTGIWEATGKLEYAKPPSLGKKV